MSPRQRRLPPMEIRVTAQESKIAPAPAAFEDPARVVAEVEALGARMADIRARIARVIFGQTRPMWSKAA